MLGMTGAKKRSLDGADTSGRSSQASEATAIEWDAPGMLSIVVQGALFQGNLVETANHCRHWRELFPKAQIIMVISVTDVVTGKVTDGVFTSLKLVMQHRFDGHLQAALSVIMECCDKVCHGKPALPLPPIKQDSPKPNNMNFQIAAAQRGLEEATGRYVLRIRSDLIFGDRSFLSQYVEGNALPRGKATSFKQRVMISWLYTLNPFTVERMPLHFSDWFHFGLTDDVRAIWDVPPVTLQDAIYYRTRPHDPDSNAAERLFNIRVAVEQHLIYNCFKARFPELQLGYHNDRRSIGLAMDILIDNFILCDMLKAHSIFDKYSHEFFDHSKRVHCVTPDLWRSMARSRVMPYEAMLSTSAATEAAEEQSSDHGRFPLFFPATRLKTRAGEFVDGQIVARQPNGVLFYGPYIGLRKGAYTAVVNVGHVSSSGTLTLAATAHGGNTELARKTFSLRRLSNQPLGLSFEIPSTHVSDLEIVCTLKNVSKMEVSGVTISEGTIDIHREPKLTILRSVLRG